MAYNSINPNWLSNEPGAMCLGDYLATLFDESGSRMSKALGLHGIVRSIRDGKPIAKSHANKIAAWLSSEYEREIRVSDIKGLNIVNPGRDSADQAAADG
jgi:hypothetical protein